MLIAGSVYLAWWFAVELLLPDALNPFIGRFLVVLFIFLSLGATYVNQWAKRSARLLFVAGVWFMTLHYYYLFYLNAGDTNWIVGAYITVIAISLGLLTTGAMVSYSIFVLTLSALMVMMIPGMGASVFLPGLVTIVLQANVGSRSRLSLIKQAEKEKVIAMNLAENVRVRDEFISIASHELKTPLAAIHLQLQLISRDFKRGLDQANMTKRIEDSMSLFDRQIMRLNELVETMLDVSRISSGRFTMNLEKVDLSKLVQSTVSALPVELLKVDQAPEIIIEASAALFVDADSSRLQQVIENIVTNAIKYGEGRPVKVKVFEREGSVVFEVTDQGMGIAPESMERIFDRFERAISSRNISGFGLGLYISRKIVELHGGTISVISRQGVGSTFTVQLKKIE